MAHNTPLKKITFTIPNVYKTMSDEIRLAGTIPTTQAQTPTTHAKLISSDERRFTIRRINGILKNGINTPLNIPNHCAADSISLNSERF